jgi:D-alanine-D-alanine ligase
MSVCLDKAVTKSVIDHAGLPTPRFDVVQETGCAAAIDRLRFPLFAKPVAEGTGKGVTPASRIRTPEELDAVCRRLLQQYQQPVLVEEYLPGREFTVGILGTGSEASCLGTLEIVLQDQAEPDVYSYINKEKCEELVEYRLVDARRDPTVRQAEEVSLAAWRALGCRDGGRIDLRCDAQGCPQFVEANPLAGLHPTHSDLPMLATATGMSYVELIQRIVHSALRRVGPDVSRLAQPGILLPTNDPPGSAMAEKAARPVEPLRGESRR